MMSLVFCRYVSYSGVRSSNDETHMKDVSRYLQRDTPVANLIKHPRS